MPIFEYVCGDCARHFEFLARGAATPRCTACGSERLEKQLSVFAVSAKSHQTVAPRAAAPCGSCGDPRGPGACSMN